MNFDFYTKAIELLAMHIECECGDGDAILYYVGSKYDDFNIIVDIARKKFHFLKIDCREDTFHFHDGFNTNIVITRNEKEWNDVPSWFMFKLQLI